MQATKDCLTREYIIEDGAGGSRDQYLAENNINTFIITGFTDEEVENNNQQEKTMEPEVSRSVKTDSPVLTVENLPKVYIDTKYFWFPLCSCALPQILVTNVSNETRESPDWAPEIPFESLARPEVSEEDLGQHSLDEELNNLMDISIEIESNKVMKADFIDSWTVSLRNSEMMAEYSRQSDQTYRSSIFSLTVLWILVFLRDGGI